MNPEKFARIAESLRQYRRAELRDFQDDLGELAVDKLYVDPLPNDAILKTVCSSNTTFILGRKGTGKSTVFARAQSKLRSSKNVISCYLDVKSLYDLAKPSELVKATSEFNLDAGICRSHLLRKAFLGSILSEVLKELKKASDEMSIWDRWLGKKRTVEDLESKLTELADRVRKVSLTDQELPILRSLERTWKSQIQTQKESRDEADVNVKVSALDLSTSANAKMADFEKSLDDTEVYKEYSSVVLSTFPFEEIINEIKDLLQESALQRLVVFFDDFSELSYLDQRLFVDVVLAPLNNSSNEAIKLKVAGYPGRTYYGAIDPTKIDTVSLDFSDLYEATDVQTMEQSATDYTIRLLNVRFEAFGENIRDYFDEDTSLDEHMRNLFQATFNVPRLMGSLLHTCYLDRISKRVPITPASMRLAARKYHESTISKYFETLNKFALEPFDNKLDRQNQKKLLDHLVAELTDLRRKISAGSIGGTYFSELSNPPVSHFLVSKSAESLFDALEANFLVSRYKATRDKDGKPATIFAIYYGLAELERIPWGYPPGRQYRNYFVQRCFDLTVTVHSFISGQQTIRCSNCKSSFSMEQKASFEMFKWRCPECGEGRCEVVNLSDEFSDDLEQISEDLLLEPVELEILNTLNDEERRMAAGEISTLIDVTYQLVGRRTAKLQEKGLVNKTRIHEEDQRVRSEILQMAKDIYFKS
ncbi:hypothetical protein IWQ55_002796 [Labrenzia sp. EL_208]|nr:hypothetical protein [Labrenzia sp. EL_132]MBG6229583.1 hypothetical protein [Labrenzia sp. EL_208]